MALSPGTMIRRLLDRPCTLALLIGFQFAFMAYFSLGGFRNLTSIFGRESIPVFDYSRTRDVYTNLSRLLPPRGTPPGPLPYCPERSPYLSKWGCGKDYAALLSRWLIMHGPSWLLIGLVAVPTDMSRVHRIGRSAKASWCSKVRGHPEGAAWEQDLLGDWSVLPGSHFTFCALLCHWWVLSCPWGMLRRTLTPDQTTSRAGVGKTRSTGWI